MGRLRDLLRGQPLDLDNRERDLVLRGRAVKVDREAARLARARELRAPEGLDREAWEKGRDAAIRALTGADEEQVVPVGEDPA